jgi:hypothetical protein
VSAVPAAAERALRCPSAQPGMTDVQVLGVANGTPAAPRIAYLNETLPASAEVLEAAAPFPATQVLRLAAKCEEHRCAHFDGHNCQLAVRIVGMLDAVTDAMPPCVIRKTCRWYAQEGRAACLRCPQILTSISVDDENLARVAGRDSLIASKAV